MIDYDIPFQWIYRKGQQRHDVGSEHVMLGLLKEGSGVAYTVLNKLGVTAEAYEKLIRERIGTGEPTSLSPDEFTPRTKRILQVAAVAGAQLHNAYVGTEHLLIGHAVFADFGRRPQPHCG